MVLLFGGVPARLAFQLLLNGSFNGGGGTRELGCCEGAVLALGGFPGVGAHHGILCGHTTSIHTLFALALGQIAI